MGNIITLIIFLVLGGAAVFGLIKLKPKPLFKLVFILLIITSVVMILRSAMSAGWLPTPGFVKALVPEKTQSFSGSITAAPASYEVPAAPASYQGPPLRVLSIPWNAVSSLTVANGGPMTTPDSLVRQYSGLTLNISNQPDYAVMKDELVKFAQGWKHGDASQGAAFVVMMGDQWVSFERSVRDRLSAEGQKVVVFGVLGFSNGEDGCWGKPLNGNPQNAKGSLILRVPYDGDDDVCIKFASDNGIKYNPSQDTYDPEAINVIDTTTYADADDKFIAGTCVDRFLIENGKKSAKKVNKCADGVASWTPGDVAIATRKGGVQRWASTKEYNLQMPAVIIGNKDWLEKNRAAVAGLLRATDRGSFKIRGSGGLQSVGVNASIFATPGSPEASPEFWVKYFPGATITDATGMPVEVGGSRVVGLAETRDYFGLTPGSFNTYKGVLETTCKWDTTFWPKDVPDCGRYEDIVDTSFVQAALQGVNAAGPKQVFTESRSMTSAVSSRSYALEFETGSTRLTPASVRTINEIANSAGMTQLRIRISGHTDNTGNPGANLALSRGRAQAVADALYSIAPQTFPRERLEVQGYGDSSPVADNSTESGRAKNRRVEITLGQ